MEHLTRRFGVMLDAAVGQDAPPAPFRDAFSVQYENLTVYFLFRYALKAVNDRQYLARVEQCVFHLLCLRELSADAATVQELTEVVSLYSKEVEHSEDNQALLLKLFRRGTLRWQYLASILDFDCLCAGRGQNLLLFYPETDNFFRGKRQIYKIPLYFQALKCYHNYA